MTDYKHATAWLDCLSKSPPQEHGGFDPDTIEGATVSLREILRLKRENTLMRYALNKLWENRHVPSICINVATWEYIERKMPSLLPDLFKAKRRGSK